MHASPGKVMQECNAVYVIWQAYLGRTRDLLESSFVLAPLAQGELGAKDSIKYSSPREMEHILILTIFSVSNIKAEFSNPFVVNFGCIAKRFPAWTGYH